MPDTTRPVNLTADEFELIVDALRYWLENADINAHDAWKAIELNRRIENELRAF